jgi:hypothetical protein
MRNVPSISGYDDIREIVFPIRMFPLWYSVAANKENYQKFLVIKLKSSIG